MDSEIELGFINHVPDETSLVCADILKKTYDLGVQIFGECLKRASPDMGDEELVPALILRDVCRHVMATSILARNGFAEPCDLTARALYESSISLIYMLDGDTAKKAGAYRIMDVVERFKLTDKLSPYTHAGKSLRDKLRDDRIGRLDSPIFNHVPEAERELQGILTELRKDPVRNAAFHEYENVMREQRKGKGKRLPPWYQLFGGPTSLRGLAEETKMLYSYETFYNLASKNAHGVNALHVAAIPRKTGVLDIPIMSSRDIEVIAGACVGFTLIAYRKMIDLFCPEMLPSFNSWLAEVQSLRKKIEKTPSPATPKE